jgi:hypothetical protein
MNPTSDGASRSFVYASTAIATLILAWCFFAASRQWFVYDDFWFLAFASGPRHWVRIFLPLEPRPWWSYRPLSIDVFFFLCGRLFNRDPVGYLTVSLSLHCLTGLVVYRLARQFGLETRAAVLTALLSVSRYPSLTEGLWISVCQYTITMFFYALSLSFFIDYARSTRITFQIASCTGLILALLSNELGVTLAAVVGLISLYQEEFSFSAKRLVRALRRVAPQVTITAAYLLFRIKLIGPTKAVPVPTEYQWVTGWHILSNYFWALVFVFGSERVRLLESLMPLAAALLAIAASRETRGALVKPLLAVSLVSIGWIVVGMLPYVGMPYVGMPFMRPRFAMSIELPVCLLCGACLNAFSRVYSSKRPAAVETVLLAALVLSLPYRAAWDAATNPKGETVKRLVSLVGDQHASLPKGAAVVVLYGSKGLGSVSESEEFWFRAMGGAVFWAFYGDKDLKLHMMDASTPPPIDLKCPPCLFLDLEPGLMLEPAAREPAAYTRHGSP